MTEVINPNQDMEPRWRRTADGSDYVVCVHLELRRRHLKCWGWDPHFSYFFVHGTEELPSSHLSVRIPISSFQDSDDSAHHHIFNMLSTAGAHPETVESMTPDIVVKIREKVEEAPMYTSIEVNMVLDEAIYVHDEDEGEDEVAMLPLDAEDVDAFGVATTESVNDDGQGSSPGLRWSRSSAEIETLFHECRVQGPIPDGDCAICMEGLDDGEKKDEGITISCLPCSHCFHEACIRRWLDESDACPLCRIAL